jgi:hypothetical protein
MLRQIDFLCDALVKDTQCAREIWNLLGVELMKPTTPSVIRASIIRVFPKLCMANKRLYKRAIEALGNNLAQSDNLEIRLAVAATIADLAREDRIRDVTDVIGFDQYRRWISKSLPGMRRWCITPFCVCIISSWHKSWTLTW